MLPNDNIRYIREKKKKKLSYYLFSSSYILTWEELFFRDCSLWEQYPVGVLLFPFDFPSI